VDKLVVVYDASVLYPAPLRSLLMYLALTGEFHAKWSEAIHDEWTRSLARDRPDIASEKIAKVRRLMKFHIPDGNVSDFESLIPTLTLPDPDDRHVLAAAIHAQASVIVTVNLRDFPATVLAGYGIEALHPDEFVIQLINQSPESVCGAVREQRESLTNPPQTVEQLLATFERQGLVQTVTALHKYSQLL